MICQNCGKNEANTHIKRIINGETTELHLCQKCAKHLGYGNFFSSFFSSFLSELPPMLVQDNEERCPGCNSSFEEIASSGMLGCEECYYTFSEQLTPSISRIHGKNKHIGKKGFFKRNRKDADMKNNDSVKEEKADVIAKYKKELEEAVSKQEFEQAAVLRDKIKEIENKGETK